MDTDIPEINEMMQCGHWYRGTTHLAGWAQIVLTYWHLIVGWFWKVDRDVVMLIL